MSEDATDGRSSMAATLGWRIRLVLRVAVALVVATFLGAAVVPASAVAPSSDSGSDAYTYDGPAVLSSPDTVASYERASPFEQGAVSWESSIVVRGCCVAAKTVDGVADLGKGWRATSFGDEAASFEYHFSKHGATAGVTRQQYADDALGWARNPAGTGKPVQLTDGTDGLRFRTPGGGPGGILDNDGNIITYWYR